MKSTFLALSQDAPAPEPLPRAHPQTDPDELVVSLAFDYCDRKEHWPDWPDNEPNSPYTSETLIDSYLARLPDSHHARFRELINMSAILSVVEGERL